MIVAIAASGMFPMRDAQEKAPDAVRVFQDNVAAYVSLRDRLDRSLPSLDSNPTNVQVDSRREALLALLAKARAGAAKGAVFGPAMTDYARTRVRSVLDGPDGAQIRRSLMDENPTTAVVEINRRYPFAIPLSTMPAAILKILPTLPDGLQYHFVGNRLILHDTNVRMVVDIIDNVLRDRG